MRLSLFIIGRAMLALALAMQGCAASRSTSGEVRPDLDQLIGTKLLVVHNRAVTPLREEGRRGLRFDSRPLDGVAWLPEVRFTNGTVEFDVRGKDVFQRSFVGLAFHGLNDSTFEAVYFRPFNFDHAEPVRRRHAVQYVSNPEQPWNRLRQEHPDQYEAAVQPAPKANEWFHVRIRVQAPRVTVFVNDSPTPCLDVTQLRAPVGEGLGLFVGDNSDGDFANLRIRHQP